MQSNTFETHPVIRSGPKNNENEFSKQRHRIHLAHKRNLVLREIFKEKLDIQSLEQRRDFDRQQPAKKGKLKNDGRKEKRQKVDSNEEGGKMSQGYMDED